MTTETDNNRSSINFDKHVCHLFCMLHGVFKKYILEPKRINDIFSENIPRKYYLGYSNLFHVKTQNDIKNR